MGWFERIVSMDGRLQGKARRDRRLVFLVSLGVGFITGLSSMFATLWPLQAVAVYGIFLPHVVMAAMCIFRVNLTPNILCVYIGMLGVGIIFTDLNQRTIGNQAISSSFVLLADLSLVLSLGRRFATGLTAVAAMWVLLSGVEVVTRFGLYDLPGSAPDVERWKHAQDASSCTNPPCPISALAGFVQTQGSLMVLLIDFAATRDFAESAEKEKASMGRTIETVEAIAQLLAGYDVDTVAEMLQEAEAEGRLPAAMHEALRRLEENLRAYRPYLPKSCLPHLSNSPCGSVDESSIVSSDAPGSITVSDSDSELLDTHRGMPMKPLGVLKAGNATTLVVNTRDSVPCLEHNPSKFTAFFGLVLTNTMSAVESRRGLVDMFIGDRILASFNTSRPCLVHASSAASAAQSIVQALCSDNTDTESEGPLRVNIGAASGRVMCGDTGCLEMRRFSLLGVLPLMACGMERAARAFGLDVVCNTTLQQDAVHEHVLLLVPRLVRLVKITARAGQGVHLPASLSDKAAVPAYELRMQAASSVHMEEWMYHIGKSASEWEPYNTAVRDYLSGHSIDQVSALVGEHVGDLRDAITLLGDRSPLDVQV